jgi:hypothetical protein
VAADYVRWACTDPVALCSLGSPKETGAKPVDNFVGIFPEGVGRGFAAWPSRPVLKNQATSFLLKSVT